VTGSPKAKLAGVCVLLLGSRAAEQDRGWACTLQAHVAEAKEHDASPRMVCGPTLPNGTKHGSYDMKKRTTAALALLVLLGVSGITGPAFASTGDSTRVPTGVSVGYTDGAVLITGFPNNVGCQSADLVFLPANGDVAKIYALANAAILSGRSLTCWLGPCTSWLGATRQKGSYCTLK
jgi:hypothetical protein